MLISDDQNTLIVPGQLTATGISKDVRYIAVPHVRGTDCTRCAFKSKPECKSTPCIPIMRIDGRNVVFVVAESPNLDKDIHVPLAPALVPKSGLFSRALDEEGRTAFVTVYFRQGGMRDGHYQVVDCRPQASGSVDGLTTPGEVAVLIAHLMTHGPLHRHTIAADWPSIWRLRCT